ncbi:MAG: tRNA (adenine(22)-N(1))-methyltransferase TrmK, partial [Planctomycetota bacterium]
LARSQCEGIAAVLVGDGFEPIPRGSGAPRVDCAILAGMGAENALEIIERGLALGHRPSRIVIQPAAKEREVRRRMPSHGYELVKESFVVDGNRLFLGLAFDSCSGERAPLKEEDLVAGPLLRREGGPLYRAWLATQLDWLEPLLQRPGPTKPSLLTRRSILERLVREQMKMRSPGEPELLPFDTIEP